MFFTRLYSHTSCMLARYTPHYITKQAQNHPFPGRFLHLKSQKPAWSAELRNPMASLCKKNTVYRRKCCEHVFSIFCLMTQKVVLCGKLWRSCHPQEKLEYLWHEWLRSCNCCMNMTGNWCQSVIDSRRNACFLRSLRFQDQSLSVLFEVSALEHLTV